MAHLSRLPGSSIRPGAVNFPFNVLTSGSLQGAAWLWYTLLEKPFKQADEVVVDFFETRLQILLGFALGSRADASATKSEKFNQARTNPVFPTPTTPAPTTTPPVTATTPMPVNATHSNPQSAE